MKTKSARFAWSGDPIFRVALLFVLGVLLAFPETADACAVCSSGREEASRTAFIIGTAFMTTLPFVLVGGLIWWIRKKSREAASLAEEIDSVSEI